MVDLREAIRAKLGIVLGTTPENARPRDWFVATALALREPDRGGRPAERGQIPHKRVYYLSLNSSSAV